MAEQDNYVLSDRRKDLWLAVDRFRTASSPFTGASTERLFELENEVYKLLVAVRRDEARNRAL